MVKIISSMIKELRECTGAGVMDCKKALIEANGNIKLAISSMRRFGAIKAAKKANNITNCGIIKTKIKNNYGIILEVNCQTDFVANETNFCNFTNKILDLALNNKIIDIEILKMHFEKERVALVNKVNENIIIRRIAAIEDDMIDSYTHGIRIGVLVATKNANKELVKQIAMHIAASKPEFIKLEDISPEILKEEYEIQFKIAIGSGKSEDIAEKIANGRVNKFISEISLVNQVFVIDPTKTVGQFLKENNINVTNFVRFELGENIKKDKINNTIKTSTTNYF